MGPEVRRSLAVPLTQIVFVGITASFFFFAGTGNALADCAFSGSSGNWAVEGAPGISVTTAHGNHGWSNVRTNISLSLPIPGPATHVESLYIWHDGINMVEFGWALDRPIDFTHLNVFDARIFDGTYANRNDFQPSTGNHAFREVYNDTTARYDFEYDGVVQNFHRDPVWVGGRPRAGGEISYQCDDGNSHWWGLTHQHLGGTWVAWSSTHWNCDTETQYGFTWISDQEFTVDGRTDGFVDGCDPFT